MGSKSSRDQKQAVSPPKQPLQRPRFFSQSTRPPNNYSSAWRLDPSLPIHPSALLKNSYIASLITNSLATSFQTITDTNFLILNLPDGYITNMLFQDIFNGKSLLEIQQDFDELDLPQQAACGKALEMRSVFFRCIDCDRQTDPTSITVLCSECFEKSDHQDHRFFLFQSDINSTGTCDCGDPTNLKPQGFCPDHKPNELSIEDLMARFPEKFLKDLTTYMKQALYEAISLHEIGQRTQKEDLRFKCMLLGDQILNDVLDFCLLCCLEIHNSFGSIFGVLFQDSFSSPFHKLWHNCDDFVGTEAIQKTIQENHTCTCTVIGALLRIGNLINQNIQEKLTKVIVEFMKEKTFRGFFVLEFTRYVHFLFSKKYDATGEEDTINSKLFDLAFQLYWGEEKLRVLDTGIFYNFLNALKLAINSCNQPLAGLFHVVHKIEVMIQFFLNPNQVSSQQLVLATNFMKDSIKVLMVMEAKFTNAKATILQDNGDYVSINRGLNIEWFICMTLERGISLLCSYPPDKKMKLIGDLIKQLQLGVKMKTQQPENISFNVPLERTFSHLLANYVGKITPKAIRTCLKDNSLDPEQVGEMMISGTLRALATVRFLNTTYTQIKKHNWPGYYYSNCGFFESDIVSIQLMSMLISPDRLFESITQNFFYHSSRLTEFFTNVQKHIYSRSEMMVLQDFLNFIAFIMQDQICSLNLRLKSDSYTSRYPKLSNDSRALIKKILANLLLGHYWVNMSVVKAELEWIMLDNNAVDELISEITVIDDKTHKVKLKEEYETEFNPHFFYKDSSIQSDIINNFAARSEKNKNTDLVSNKYNPHTPEHLKHLQRNFFKSNLPEFLSEFLINYTDSISGLVRPVLRLVLFNLQVESETSSNDDMEQESEIMREKIVKNYLSAKLSAGLDDLYRKEEFSDCKLCVETIQGLLENFEKVKTSRVSMKKVVEESNMEDKKKKAQDRMQKMKEEFARKQAAFARKNDKVLLPKDQEEQKIDIEEAICQHCLNKISQKTEAYGVPVFISFTNNLQDSLVSNKCLKEQKLTDFSKASWWPVVTSCNHYYHKECFVTVNANSRPIDHDYQDYSQIILATCCSLCKTFYNSFLCLNQQENTKSSEGNLERLLIELDNPRNTSLDTVMALKVQLFSLQKKILKLGYNLQFAQPQDVPFKLIFERLYEYFIQTSFDCQESSSLEKNLKMHLCLFRCLLINMPKEQAGRSSGSSFLTRLSQSANLHFSKDRSIHALLPQKTQTSHENKHEILLNNILFDLFVEFMSESDSLQTRKALSLAQITVVKEFILFILAYSMSFESEASQFNIKSIIEAYRTNQMAQDQLITYLIPVVQKAVFSCLVSRSILSLDQQTILSFNHDISASTEDDNEYLDKLLSYIDPSLSLLTLLDNPLSDETPKTTVENLIDSTIKTLQLVPISSLKPFKQTPQSVDLPQDLAGFTAKYYHQKCSLCNQYNISLHICLLCDAVLCLGSCPSGSQDGNLNKHASKYHMGSSLFVAIHVTQVALVSGLCNVVQEGKKLYMDKLGQTVHVYEYKGTGLLSSLDFKKFVANQELHQELKSILRSNTTGRETYDAMRNNYRFYTFGSL